MNRHFEKHLRLYGPGTEPAALSLAEAKSYCRHLALTQGETTAAAWLLPRRLVCHVHRVQAFQCWTQGLAEAAGGGAKALAQLRWWKEQVLAMYAGQPRHPVTRALHETVTAFHIPPQPLLSLIYAGEQDQLVKRYRTFEQLVNYCRHAANPLGQLLLYLHGCHNDRRAQRADCLCTGMQLAHLWCNLRRDGLHDRVYLPAEDRQRFGYADEDLNAQRTTPAFLALMECQVERARDLLLRGWPLVDLLPKPLRPEVELVVARGLALLDRIAAAGYDVWQCQPNIPSWKEATFLARTLWQRWRPLRLGA